MIFYYQKLLYHERHNLFSHHKEGDLKGYRLSRLNTYCCHNMMTSLAANSISFGDIYDPEETENITQDLNINLVKGEGGRYSTTYTFDPIHNCPFCGQPIGLKEGETVFVNKEVM